MAKKIICDFCKEDITMIFEDERSYIRSNGVNIKNSHYSLDYDLCQSCCYDLMKIIWKIKEIGLAKIKIKE